MWVFLKSEPMGIGFGLRECLGDRDLGLRRPCFWDLRLRPVTYPFRDGRTSGRNSRDLISHAAATDNATCPTGLGFVGWLQPFLIVDNNQLISAAESVLHPRTVKGRVFGDVGAAILGNSGRLFVGVSVDTPSWGFCAERCALAAMIAAGEYSFKKAVAVWKDPASQLLYILPPVWSLPRVHAEHRRREPRLRNHSCKKSHCSPQRPDACL